MIPTVQNVIGVLLVARSPAKRKAEIEATQEEINSLLGDLDPVAEAQVAESVVEAHSRQELAAKPLP